MGSSPKWFCEAMRDHPSRSSSGPSRRLISGSSVATSEVRHRTKTLQFLGKYLCGMRFWALFPFYFYDVSLVNREKNIPLRFRHIWGDEVLTPDFFGAPKKIDTCMAIEMARIAATFRSFWGPGSTCRPTHPMRGRWTLEGEDPVRSHNGVMKCFW